MFVFWGRMLGEYSRRGFACARAKSGVLPHLCAKERVCVCVLSAELPDGCYLRESDGQRSWRGTPIV